MKIIHKTIRTAFNNWTPCKSIRCYHYASAFDGNKMISFAQNTPTKSSAAAYRIGKDFNISKYQKFPFYHAESHLISKLLNSFDRIDPNWSVVVMRINRIGLILGSKPCDNCAALLKAVGLTKIFYSTDNGDFCDASGDLIKVDSLTVPMSMV